MKPLLACLIAVLMLPATAAAETYCYLVYNTTRFNCYEYTDPVYGYMGKCDSYTVYDKACHYDWDDPQVIDPPFIGDDVPAYIDVAWIYVAGIDDANPQNIRVVANAAPELDLFSLEYNGQPYGTAYGSGYVSIEGVPAGELGSSGKFWVQACDTALGVCAAAEATTFTSPAQKSEFGGVTAWYPEEGPSLRLENYPRSVTVKYDVRGYSVYWSPGSTRSSYTEVISGFTYDHVRRPPTIRSESILWRVEPGSPFATSCQPNEIWGNGSSIEPPTGTTSLQGCNTAGTVGSSGVFMSSIETIAELPASGFVFAFSMTNRDLEVTAP